MAVSASIVFETRKGNANEGKIVCVFTDTPATLGATWQVDFGVISPLGVTLRDISGANVAMSAGGTATILVDIPKTSDGKEYLGGEYELEIYYNNTASSNPQSTTRIYEYCPKHSVDHSKSDYVKREYVLDCLAETLLLRDITDWEGQGLTRLTRNLSITPPVITGESPTESNSLSSISVNLSYTNVVYQTLMEATFEYDSDGEDTDMLIISRGSVFLYDEVKVDCKSSFCDTVYCLYERLKKLRVTSQRCGGWSYVPAHVKDEYEWAMTLVNMATMLRDCGSFVESKKLIDEATALLGGDCSCGCDDLDKPKPI